MVLDELHVLERHACPVGQGHPVASVDGRVGGEREDPTKPARAQDDGLGREASDHRVADVDGGQARAPAIFHQEPGDEELVIPVDALVLE